MLITTTEVLAASPKGSHASRKFFALSFAAVNTSSRLWLGGHPQGRRLPINKDWWGGSAPVVFSGLCEGGLLTS